ncbi:trans-sialidase [Trypanosoma cruzi]|nr:trans-sialidase [Trypanosoma cruzi]
MGALGRKALPRVSQRSAHRKRRPSTTSGRGRGSVSNTASSILLPFGIPEIILLLWYCAEFGVERDAGEAPQCHTAMPYIAFACTSARWNALRVSLLVLHATDKISFRWSRRCSGSSWGLAARASSISVLELDAQKGRHAPHSGQRALASRVWWGRVAVEKGRCASSCWRFPPWGFLWSTPLRRFGLLVATRSPHPRRRAA